MQNIKVNIKHSPVLVFKYLHRTVVQLFHVTWLLFVSFVDHQKPLNNCLQNEILPNYDTQMLSLIIILIFNFGSKVITDVPNFPNSVFHYQRHIR
jgi:hypothetical protein